MWTLSSLDSSLVNGQGRETLSWSFLLQYGNSVTFQRQACNNRSFSRLDLFFRQETMLCMLIEKQLLEVRVQRSSNLLSLSLKADGNHGTFVFHQGLVEGEGVSSPFLPTHWGRCKDGRLAIFWSCNLGDSFDQVALALIAFGGKID